MQNKTTLERIKEYIDYKGITIRAFELEVGFSNGSFASQLKNNKTIGVDKLENILNTYPEVNPTWLLTGDGDMLLDFTKGITGGEKPEVDKEFNKINEEVTLLRKLINANTDVKVISDAFEGFASGFLVINGIVQQYDISNKMQDVLTCYSDNKAKTQDVKEELKAHLENIKELVTILKPYESSILEIFEKLIDFDKRHDQEFSLDE